MEINTLDRIYDSNIIFKDPVGQIRGIDALHAYTENLCSNITEGRFEYLDQIVSQGNAYIKWNMYFKHPKLGDQLISVRGMSHLQFHEKIYYHEDVYDLGEMFYEHLPLIGTGVRWVKGKIKSV